MSSQGSEREATDTPRELKAGWQARNILIRWYQPRATGRPEGKNPPNFISSVVPPPQSAAPIANAAVGGDHLGAIQAPQNAAPKE